MSQPYCVTITTHEKRFEMFKRTLDQFRSQTSAPIFVSVNGNYDTPMDDAYRLGVLAECQKYQRVYPSFYGSFRGLAKIWNDQICHSGYNDVIVTNDDVNILPGFVAEFVKMWFSLNPRECLKVNGAFSTFFINKAYLDTWGYFEEEHFLGIGWEDMEFVHRTHEYPHMKTNLYDNLTEQTKGDLGTGSVGGKYSRWNRYWFNNSGPTRNKNLRPFEKYYTQMYPVFWNWEKDRAREDNPKKDV